MNTNYQPNEATCRADVERIDRSIWGFMVIQGKVRAQFYDFNSARNFRDKVKGEMLPMLIDPLKPIYGIKKDNLQ